MNIQHVFAIPALALATLGALGCTGSVEPTDDSTRIELEVPKVEIGDEPVDLDPTTDGDVDIDTPRPGDS